MTTTNKRFTATLTEGTPDVVTIQGAGSETDTHFSTWSDERQEWDLLVPVDPAEDREPYERALEERGFRTVVDNGMAWVVEREAALA